MRLKHHQLIRPFALAATAALIATMLALAFGAGIGLAADYEDGAENVCEGPVCSDWGKHVTGFRNVALGAFMMPALTKGAAPLPMSRTFIPVAMPASSNRSRVVR